MSGGSPPRHQAAERAHRRYGSPKLTDFGIARALDTAHSTSTDSYLGTATYSSPEQLQGERVTPKSDVYSLGATLPRGGRRAAVHRGPAAGRHPAARQAPRSAAGARGARGRASRSPDPRLPRQRCRRQAGRLRPAREAAPDQRRRDHPSRGRHRSLGLVRAQEPPDPPAPRGPGLQARVGKGDARALRAAGGHDQHPDADLQGRFEAAESACLDRRRATPDLRHRRGAWALFDPTAGGVLGRSNASPNRCGRHPPCPRPNNGPRTRLAEWSRRSRPRAGPGAGLPAAAAEQAVFDMYYEMSFARPDTSYAYLSERLQNEIGSVQQWHSRRTSTLSLTWSSPSIRWPKCPGTPRT